MIYSFKPITNSYDMVAWDYMELIDGVAKKLPKEDDAFSYVLDLHMNNRKIAEFWPDNIEVRFTQGYLNQQYDLGVISGFLALRERAYQVLKPLLECLGEFIHIKVGDEVVTLFNPLTFGEVDIDKCEREVFEGELLDYKKIVFNESDVIKKALFKCKLNGGVVLYCNDEIKHAVESAELSGINIDSDINNIF